MTLIQASSLDDLMEVVHHSSMMREGVLPVGNTTRIRRHSANPNPAHLLSLSKMNQILELNPEEQTCVVEFGKGSIKALLTLDKLVRVSDDCFIIV